MHFNTDTSKRAFCLECDAHLGSSAKLSSRSIRSCGDCNVAKMFIIGDKMFIREHQMLSQLFTLPIFIQSDALTDSLRLF